MRKNALRTIVALLGLFVLVAGSDRAGAESVTMVIDGGIQFADGTIQYSAQVGFASVADSGQKRCWNEDGDEISCGGSCQDGEWQAGSDWPAPRFVDNHDGTVTDVLTGLIWLRDADCFGTLTWSEALTQVDGLMAGVCELEDGSLANEWRLPNIREMMSVIDFSQSSPALVVGHPFEDVRSAAYWTSTTAVGYPSNAWAVGLDTGFSDSGSKQSLSLHVWAVRGGN